MLLTVCCTYFNKFKLHCPNKDLAIKLIIHFISSKQKLDVVSFIFKILNVNINCLEILKK